MTRSLDGASILVAGASGELGRRIAEGLHARGARVSAFVRDPARLPAGVPFAAVAIGDLAEATDCAKAVEHVVTEVGRLDGVVNAAGVVAFGPLAELDDHALEQLFRVNTLGPLRLVRAALAELSEGGFVANIAAVVAEAPMANLTAYSASKAALSAADVALHRELRRSKLTVIDIRPPHTETGLAGRPLSGVAPKLPAGLEPDHVASRIVSAIEADEREVPSTAF